MSSARGERVVGWWGHAGGTWQVAGAGRQTVAAAAALLQGLHRRGPGGCACAPPCPAHWCCTVVATPFHQGERGHGKPRSYGVAVRCGSSSVRQSSGTDGTDQDESDNNAEVWSWSGEPALAGRGRGRGAGAGAWQTAAGGVYGPRAGVGVVECGVGGTSPSPCLSDMVGASHSPALRCACAASSGSRRSEAPRRQQPGALELRGGGATPLRRLRWCSITRCELLNRDGRPNHARASFITRSSATPACRTWQGRQASQQLPPPCRPRPSRASGRRRWAGRPPPALSPPSTATACEGRHHSEQTPSFRTHMPSSLTKTSWPHRGTIPRRKSRRTPRRFFCSRWRSCSFW